MGGYVSFFMMTIFIFTYQTVPLHHRPHLRSHLPLHDPRRRGRPQIPNPRLGHARPADHRRHGHGRVVRDRARGEHDPEATTLELGLGPGLFRAGPEYDQAFDTGVAWRGSVEGLCEAEVCGGGVSWLESLCSFSRCFEEG